MFRNKHSKAIKQRIDKMYISPTIIEMKNNFDSTMKFSKSVLEETKDTKKIKDGSDEEISISPIFYIQ